MMRFGLVVSPVICGVRLLAILLLSRYWRNAKTPPPVAKAPSDTDDGDAQRVQRVYSRPSRGA
jgi:hypothetical protein